MKKAISSLAALYLVVTLALSASAAGISDVANPESLYPVDIILDLDSREIRKVYDLSPSTDPSTLPMAAFERDGLAYNCTDILREVIIGTETQPLAQAETVESKKKDLETLLTLLPQEREVTTEEGFTGTLRLDLDSIETKVSGYGSSKQAVTATRSYPNLSDADTQHLPKTIEDNGRTLTLSDVQWQTDNTYNADDYEIGDRYTAICTYSGFKTVSYVKGYTTTADYVGDVHRTGVTMIRYTVIFTGEEIPEPVAVDGSESGFLMAALIIGGLILVAVAGGCGAYMLVKHRKERMTDEEMDPESSGCCGDGNTDADPGTGAGV